MRKTRYKVIAWFQAKIHQRFFRKGGLMEKITIPKKVAESNLTFFDIYLCSDSEESIEYFKDYRELPKEVIDFVINNYKIVALYLVSKDLGLNLIEVVE